MIIIIILLIFRKLNKLASTTNTHFSNKSKENGENVKKNWSGFGRSRRIVQENEEEKKSVCF